MPDHLDAMKDFIDLICLLLTTPELDGGMPWSAPVGHLNKIMERHFQAEGAIRLLANP
jgi:hypothetical protein